MRQPHQEMQDKLPALALGVLEGTELDDVTRHVRDCHACADLLHEYRAAAAGVARALPPRPWPPEHARLVRDRLLSRARGVRRTPLQLWSGWLAAAGLTGVLLIHHSIHRPVAYGWMAAGALWLVLVGVGVYALIQRRRVQALQAAARDPRRGRSA